MENSKKKVIIGMSSGVDSSTSVAILKKQGFDVQGVFLLMFGDAEKNKKNIEDVEKVCAKIEIPLKIVDAREEFKNKVVKYFIKEYKSGKTPNPCVYCNENFKFKLLFQEMKKAKADYVATGHYAQIKKQETRNKKQEKKYELIEAKDKNKDQSYFLYRLKPRQLAKIIFPLGELEKTEVRNLARKFELPVSEKKESQDVCFLKDEKIEEFLRKNIKMKKGDIVDENGKIIGTHNGFEAYTIGQRKGIAVGGDGPYYVLRKNGRKNILVVSNNKNSEILYKKEIKVKNINWISEEPVFPAKVFVRTRFRNPLISAIIDKYKVESRKYKVKNAKLKVRNKESKTEYKIKFEKPQWAVTLGQSVVFYGKKGEALGGEIIK